MTVHFDLHKYRQKLSVWHQFDKINVGPQNNFIFFVFVHSFVSMSFSMSLCVCPFQCSKLTCTLRIPSLQEWKYWLCFVINDYDRWQYLNVHIHWFKLKLMKSVQWFLDTQCNRNSLVADAMADLLSDCKICLRQTSNKLKYFVVKLIYIDLKKRIKCRYVEKHVMAFQQLHLWSTSFGRRLLFASCVCVSVSVWFVFYKKTACGLTNNE